MASNQPAAMAIIRPARQQSEALRQYQYQQAVQAAAVAESNVRDIVEGWRRMPNIPDRSTIAAALQPRAFVAAPAPSAPDLELDGRILRWQIRQEVAARHTKVPFYVALAGLVAGFATTGVTNEGAFGALALVGFVFYVPVWGVRRYVRILRQVREQFRARWLEVEGEHRTVVAEHREHQLQLAQTWEQRESERVSLMQQLVAGDREVVDDVVQGVLEDLDFPFEATCAAKVLADDTVVVAIDLPEIEDLIPEERAKVLKNGTTKQVRRSRKERNDAWRRLVLGTALQIGRTICAAAPSIQQIKMAGFTQRRQRSGVLSDEWVYELVAERAFLVALRPETVEPDSLLKLPSARLMPAADGDLKKIPPPDWVEGLLEPPELEGARARTIDLVSRG